MFRNIRYSIIIIALVLCASIYQGEANAGTCGSAADGVGTTHKTGSSPWTADSASYADVDYCVNTAAAAGDTVNVPAGTPTWASVLTITKGVTLIGAGMANTIITGNLGDNIINYHPSNPALNEVFDMSGFTIDANKVANSICLKMQVRSDVAITKVRIHENKFTKAATQAIRVEGMVYGLVDHNQFVGNNYDLKILGKDTYTWQNYPGIGLVGTGNYLYIEDNISTGVGTIVLSSGEGARWVYRYNAITIVPGNAVLFDAHGDTLNRGVVAFELYENRVIGGYQYKALDYRGGTGIIFNNVMEAVGAYQALIQVREEYASCTNPGGCSGDNGGCGDAVNNGYIWNNKNAATSAILTVEAGYGIAGCIQEKTNWWDDFNNTRDYFTKGQARPATCTAGDVYWETGNRKLYRCTATNTWTKVYEPFIYPHPLSQRVASHPSPAQHLRISMQ